MQFWNSSKIIPISQNYSQYLDPIGPTISSLPFEDSREDLWKSKGNLKVQIVESSKVMLSISYFDLIKPC